MQTVISYAGQGTFIGLPYGAVVSSVRVNGAAVSYTVSPWGITLSAAPPLRSEIAVDYEVRSGITAGVWYPVPTVFRLRIAGSGTITLDSRTASGVETSSVVSYSGTNDDNQIEFPYLGDDVTHVRASFPSTLFAEILP